MLPDQWGFAVRTLNSASALQKVPHLPLDQTDSRLFNTYGGYVFLQVPHELFPMYFFLPLFGSFDVFLLQGSGGEYLVEIMV